MSLITKKMPSETELKLKKYIKDALGDDYFANSDQQLIYQRHAIGIVLKELKTAKTHAIPLDMLTKAIHKSVVKGTIKAIEVDIHSDENNEYAHIMVYAKSKEQQSNL